MPPICAFDVNGTLLDLAVLDPHFERVFSSADMRREWFHALLESAFVATLLGVYSDFSAHGRAALTVVAQRHGVSISGEDERTILEMLRRLPAHPDAREGLRRLRDVGARLVALTNSPLASAEEVLTFAGLRDLFELVLSADEVRRLKPAPEPYHMAARRLGVAVEELWLVAAHGWDIAGAQHAGCLSAFIARPGETLDPLSPPPRIIAPDLRECAERILAVDAEH